MRIQQCNIYMLPLPAAGALMQGTESPPAAIHARAAIAYCDPGFLWPTTRQVIPLAGNAHQPPHALDHKIITWQRRHRTCLPKAGDRAINQAGVNFLDGLIIQTIFFEATDLEVFNQNITVFGQLTHQIRPLGLGKLNGDRPLVRSEEHTSNSSHVAMSYAV